MKCYYSLTGEAWHKGTITTLGALHIYFQTDDKQNKIELFMPTYSWAANELTITGMDSLDNGLYQLKSVYVRFIKPKERNDGKANGE